MSADADLATMTDNELLSVVRSTAATLRKADAVRLRQARAIRILREDRNVKRSLVAEAAGVTESAVRQTIVKLGQDGNETAGAR